jgi:hypothetical protein
MIAGSPGLQPFPQPWTGRDVFAILPTFRLSVIYYIPKKIEK